MYLPQNHMVAPKEKALQCPDCHGAGGRVHWRALGYASDPVTRPLLEHEPIPLLDADGEMVHESGNPLSMSETCSQCHEIEDEDFVATHAYHSAVATSDLTPERRGLMMQGPRVPLDEGEEMNCFLCHLERPNLAEWRDALQSEEPDWAVAATLIGTRLGLKGAELLRRTDDGYAWNAAALDGDELAVIPMEHPRPKHCGNCHGLVYTDDRPLTLRLGSDAHWSTENTGQVFSAQSIRLSALNLHDKDRLGRPWDVHAQRLVECRDCHYSKEPPEHLIGEAAAGEASDTLALRRCESCHAPDQRHDWLPEQQKHFAAVACESCHAPQAHLPARKQVDASMLTADGDYIVSYRGLPEGRPDDLGRAYSVGYRPLLMKWPNAEGVHKWIPMNIVSRWYWAEAATGVEVHKAQLQAALFDGSGYRPEVIAAFDTDGDGKLSPGELRLDSEAKLALMRTLLTNQGVVQPELRASLRAHHIHHGLTHGDAQRDCTGCHAPEDGVAEPGVFELAAHLPGGVLPSVFHGVPEAVRDAWQRTADGGLRLLRPEPLSTKKVRPEEGR